MQYDLSRLIKIKYCKKKRRLFLDKLKAGEYHILRLARANHSLEVTVSQS